MDLKDKRALITGGTSGMGIATGLAMAEKGATVILTGRDETRGASAAEEIRAGGHDAQFIAADFSEFSEVGRVAEEAGEVDVLVNLAGVAAMGATADIDERRSTVSSTSGAWRPTPTPSASCSACCSRRSGSTSAASSQSSRNPRLRPSSNTRTENRCKRGV